MNRSQILKRLSSTARLEQSWKSLSALGTASVITASIVFGAIVLESLFHGGVSFRTALWWLIIATGAGSFTSLVVLPLLKALGLVFTADPVTVALRVGEAYPEVSDMLANVLQISSDEPAKDGDLATSAFESTVAVADPLDFSVIIDRSRVRRAVLLGLASVGLCMLTVGLLPGVLGASWERIIEHGKSYMPPAPFTLQVQPLADTVMRGTTCRIVVTAVGTAPKEVIIAIREKGSDRYQQYTVRRDSAKTYVYQLPGLNHGVSFVAEAVWLEEGVKSDTGRIVVIDRPLIRSLIGKVHAPSYTKMGYTDFNEQQADVTALRGSIVELNIAANKELLRAEIAIVNKSSDTANADTTILNMKTAGSTASGRFTLSHSGSYSIVLTDRDGQKNVDPVQYGLVALADAYPQITLIEPTSNVELTKTALVPVVVSIADDFGFSRLRIMYRLTSSRFAPPDKAYKSIDVPIRGQGAIVDVPYVWDLNTIDVTPEDSYEFYVEVFDNDGVSGPKSARTSSLTVRMPSIDEIFAETDQTHKETQKELKELSKEAETVRKEAEQLQRELQRQQSQQQSEASWADKKKADELLKKQEQLQERMENVVKKMEEMTEKLQQNQAISPETLQKYQELQKLMKEVSSPELQKMQEQLKKAMDKISPDELQKMMKDFKFNEEEFRKNIERQLSLLKRMQAEQKTDELQKRAEELARKQDELQQRTEQSNPANKEENKRLANEQRQLEKDLQKLAEESKELEKLMKEIGQDMPLDKMEQAQRDLDPQATKDEMEKSAQQIEKGDKQDASQRQQKASQNMQRFAQQMKNMKREMKRNSQREAMRQMQKGINDLVDLSKQQESLREQMQGMDPNSAQFPQMAQNQQRLQESMQNIANSMMQLGEKSTSVSPEMAQELGDALEQMKGAMQNLADRNASMAMKDQAGAMSSMNGAASRMSEALSSMMQGEGQGQGGQGQNPGQGKGQGMSPFQRLQKLAGDQQSINEGMNQVGQSGQPLDDKQKSEIGRLASQQGKAMKALQELEQERKQIGGERKNIGNLQQIAKDMQEVMSDMQTGSITSETRMRQERILSRLLDASRSINDRDYEKARESTSGSDVGRRSPTALELPSPSHQSMRTTLEQLRLGYTKDYQNIIRQYFEALQQQGNSSRTER